MARLGSWIEPFPEGIYVRPADAWIDPSQPKERALVTHGHSDHARGGHSQVWATPETLAIMATRYGEQRGEPVTYGESVRVGEDLLFNLDILSKGGRATYVDEALYVYAMPVGLISRAASPYSRSTVDTGPLMAALVEMRDRIAPRLNPEEATAFAERLTELDRQASIAAFHRARARSNFGEMVKLIASERAVRDKILERIAHTARSAIGTR